MDVQPDSDQPIEVIFDDVKLLLVSCFPRRMTKNLNFSPSLVISPKIDGFSLFSEFVFDLKLKILSSFGEKPRL